MLTKQERHFLTKVRSGIAWWEQNLPAPGMTISTHNQLEAKGWFLKITPGLFRLTAVSRLYLIGTYD